MIRLLVVECLLWLSNRLGWWHKGYAVLAAIAVVGAVLLLMLLWFFVALGFRLGRRFQFTIRTLLVLTVAVALPCSWLGVEMRKAREQKEAVAELEKSGCLVPYEWWPFDADGEPDLLSLDEQSQSPGPAWLRNVLGADFLSEAVTVYFDRQADDTPMKPIARLAGMKVLWLNPKVTDDGLENLRDLSELRRLGLIEANVTDAGIVHLAGLTKLQSLFLDGTQVTDVGLASIVGLTQLRRLSLDGTRVTDAGLGNLLGWRNCKSCPYLAPRSRVKAWPICSGHCPTAKSPAETPAAVPRWPFDRYPQFAAAIAAPDISSGWQGPGHSVRLTGSANQYQE